MSTEYRGFEQYDDYLRSVVEIMFHIKVLHFVKQPIVLFDEKSSTL